MLPRPGAASNTGIPSHFRVVQTRNLSLPEELQEETSWLKPNSVHCTTASWSSASDAEEKTKGGIIIPDSAKEKPSQGEVTAVGPGGRDEAGKLIPIDVKVGDRVLFGKWSGTEVKLDGEELLIMKESDIMGVLT
ncbi:co-chaperonin GroES (HSP10) [Bradyrhizobium sp. AZCC 1577]